MKGKNTLQKDPAQSLKICFSIRIKGKAKTVDEIIETTIVENVDIFLTSALISTFFTYKSQLGMLGYNVGHSSFIGYSKGEVIAARKYPGSLPLFGYISCFPFNIWVCIITSIMLISLISSIDNKLIVNFNKILRHCFNYSVLLLSKSIEKSIITSTSKQILIVWLFSAFILSTQFSTYLLDFMIRPIFIARIDTLEQLAKQDHMKIFARYEGSFVTFINMTDTPLKKALHKQLRTYEIYNNVKSLLIECLPKGTCAYVNEYLAVIFSMVDLSEEQSDYEFLSLLHLSEKTDFNEPYLLLMNDDSPDWLKSNLNKMQDSFSIIKTY